MSLFVLWFLGIQGEILHWPYPSKEEKWDFSCQSIENILTQSLVWLQEQVACLRCCWSLKYVFVLIIKLVSYYLVNISLIVNKSQRILDWFYSHCGTVIDNRHWAAFALLIFGGPNFIVQNQSTWEWLYLWINFWSKLYVTKCFPSLWKCQTFPNKMVKAQHLSVAYSFSQKWCFSTYCCAYW